MVPPASHRISRVPRYSGSGSLFSASRTGLSPSLARLSNRFRSPAFACRRSATPDVRRPPVWPLPSSLATTKGIEFSFFSSGYLDVSLPRVPSYETMNSSHGDRGSPWLFAAYRVLRRQSVPWHPPCALSRLILPVSAHGPS